MLVGEFEAGGRAPRHEHLSSDLIVVGGGMAGLCCAITAARQGVRAILVQDRPVLGGNASSEVRLWMLGATSHMGNNNRWAREGGVIDEIMVENVWRNPEGNPILFDSLLLEWVVREPNITLLLNTAVSEAEKNAGGEIQSVTAYCSQSEIRYTLTAPLFCDASGDGVLAYLAGAAFRMGAEAASEFGEGLGAPVPTNDLLGHSLYFYSRDTGKPVTYIPPAFALQDISRIPRYRELRVSDTGCRLWWLEYGGNMNTVHGTEEIKWELWRVAYGVWNYIKNSGEFPEAASLTLEWMGMIPGKRESRRFEGDHILTQQDIVEQRRHFDAVSVGGWAIDLHPADGVYSAAPACMQWHSKGVYQIPLRCMYSRNISNLFLAGRIISASHVAMGSTRVMATCAHSAQAVGMAAALCTEEAISPRQLLQPQRIATLQQRLLRAGQYIPGVKHAQADNLASAARITATSTLELAGLEDSGEVHAADLPCALLLPLNRGPVPEITFLVDTASPATMQVELWRSSREGNATPDEKVASANAAVKAGRSIPITFRFDAELDADCHAFLIVEPASGISLHLSKTQMPGVLTLWQKMNRMVAKSSVQSPPEGAGIDSFPFWLPDRRPTARNLAARISPPVKCYEPAMVVNGWSRPWCGANAWSPAAHDKSPALRFSWDKPQSLSTIELTFDTDFDHPMESVLMGHPERVMPGCVTQFELHTAEGDTIAAVAHNHQTHWRIVLPEPVTTTGLELLILGHGPAPPAIFEVRCS
jgi:FAD dependent oxidoreductase